MALFDRNKKAAADSADEQKNAAAKASKPVAKKAPAKKKAAPATTDAPKSVKADAVKLARHAHTLISPRVSEKAAILASKGVFVFNVPVSANKVEVRKAVEAMYGVNVVSVNTVRGEGKPMQRGRRPGSRNRWKKALVQLKPGQKIDLYEGV